MAKYTVAHTCGHDETHQLYGPGKERDRKLAWLEATDCSDCYRAAKDAAREAANKAAAEVAGIKGLPALSGSEKQIAWAETIRIEILDRFEKAGLELLADIKEEYEPSPDTLAEVEDALALLSTEILGQSEARWWIDNRDSGYGAALGSIRWTVKQIKDRGLAPTLLAEAETRKAEAKAAEKARSDRAEAVINSIRIDLTTVSRSDPYRVLVIDGDLRVEYQPFIFEIFDAAGSCGRFSPDSLDRINRGFDDRVMSAARDWTKVQRNRKIEALLASLDGVSVASAVASKKRSQNLSVTLSDGRSAAGHHTQKTTVIDEVAGVEIDPAHPQAIRLAAEARKVVTRG